MRPVISLLIPFRDTGDRRAQFDWLQARWADRFPDAEIIVAGDDNLDPFSKTKAVNNAYRQATSDVLAMVDADVWIDPQHLRNVAGAVRAGRAAWAQPCNRVARLDEPYTRALVETDPAGDWTPPAMEEGPGIERITPVVGLVAVFSRVAFEDVGGMDERFRGWGWEDTAFNTCLATLHGRPLKSDAPVWHLWHPRGRDDNGRPTWPGQTKRNADVGKHYSEAKNNRAKMRRLVADVRRESGIGSP